MSESDPPTPEEFYASSYWTFFMTVEILAMPPIEQCNAMGNYNVAWELMDDISAGVHLVDNPLCPLDVSQKLVIAELGSTIQKVPREVLSQATSHESNVAAMRHPSWVPLRLQAEKLLRVLPKPEDYDRTSAGR